MVAAPKIALTDEEITILKSYKRSRFSLVQHKAEALLLLNGNIDINFIADFLDRRPSTVTTWAKDYQRIRMASLYTGHAANKNASKLTLTQRHEIATVLSTPPSAQDIPAQFWTVPHLKDWITSQFDVIYDSDTTYHLLLRHAGLSFKYPQVFVNAAAVTQKSTPGCPRSVTRSQKHLMIQARWFLLLMKSASNMKQKYAKLGYT